MKILVLDPFSSGPELIAQLEERGHDAVAYFQQEPAFARAQWQDIVIDDELIEITESDKFDRIVAGSDFGVVAAEVLAYRSGLPTNDVELLWHRRDKEAMADAAATAGLRIPKTWRVSRSGDVVDLMGQLCEFPDGVVVKPASSAGSDSCYICHTAEEITACVDGVLGKTNLIGTINTSCIIQERIVGDQYFVNTVSSGGTHLVTEFFVYGMEDDGATPHLFSARTLPETTPLFQSAREYAETLNDALGVKDGASHTEMRLTPDGWVLIEYNGRCMGPVIPDDVYLPARGYSQASLWAACLTDGVQAAVSLKAKGSAEQCVGWHMPQPTTAGILKQTNWQLLSDLPTFAGVYNTPDRDTRIQLTNRVTTASYGLVFYAGAPQRVEDDLGRSRAIELQGSLYCVAAEQG